MKIDEVEVLLNTVEFKKTNEQQLSGKDLQRMSATMARLLRGGIPLLRTLELLQKQNRAVLQATASHLIENLREGHSFSAALKKSGNFPSYFCETVHAGEISGNLDMVLETLAIHLEREEDRKRKIHEALAYPAFVLGLGILTLVILLQFVIPKIAAVYADFGGSLPLPTQIILLLSQLTPAIMSAFLALGLALGFCFRKQRDTFVKILWLIPFLKEFINKAYLSRFASFFSLMLASGIPIVEVFKMAAATSSFSFFCHELREAREAVSEGEGFVQALSHASWCEPNTLALIEAGQESGKVSEALQEIAKDTQNEIESKIQFLLKLLEPALILVVGLVVGAIVISAILPVLEINELVR